ncbi:MAG: division/cell wall cluster transcriptional repressor MraZ [Elusimicrobia bacterium]|nr:division/cell wall cluster transcriptional repressor MraZ [Elusimicrobiota bacterium]
MNKNPNFIGTTFYSLDTKNRLAIPAKFRLLIPHGQTLILSQGLEGCLELYPSNSWKLLSEKLENISIKNKKDKRAFKRILFANASEVEFDEEGRILIPQLLIDYAVLKKETAVIGLGEKIEIWAKHLWIPYYKKQKNLFIQQASKIEL